MFHFGCNNSLKAEAPEFGVGGGCEDLAPLSSTSFVGKRQKRIYRRFSFSLSGSEGLARILKVCARTHINLADFMKLAGLESICLEIRKSNFVVAPVVCGRDGGGRMPPRNILANLAFSTHMLFPHEPDKGGGRRRFISWMSRGGMFLPPSSFPFPNICLPNLSTHLPFSPHVRKSFGFPPSADEGQQDFSSPQQAAQCDIRSGTGFALVAKSN